MMKTIAYGALVVAAISLIVALISRFTMTPITYATGGMISAESLLDFSNTCLLIAIALTLLEMLKK